MPEPNPCGMIMVGSVSVSFKWSCDLVLVLLIIGGNLEDISRSWRRMAHLLTALFLFSGKILLLRCVNVNVNVVVFVACCWYVINNPTVSGKMIL